MSGPGNVGPVVQPGGAQPPPPGVQVHPQVVQQQQQPLAPPPPGVQHVLPPHGLGGGIHGFPAGQGVLPPQLPGMLGAGQQVQGSVHSALWNSQYAFNKAAKWAKTQAQLTAQSCAALSKSMVKNERWARDLKISQEQSKFKAPGDRKAVGYLLEEGFDLKVLYDAMSLITPANNAAPVVTGINVQEVEKTLGSVVSFLQKRTRLRKVEEESYRIAREATFGWRTEKLFRRDDVFRSEDYDCDLQPWEQPELSDDKKWDRMRSSDREVKFQIANARKSDDVHPSAHPYARQGLGQGHDGGKKCFNCGLGGHLARTCFNKGRPYNNQPSLPSSFQHPYSHGQYQPRYQQQQPPAQNGQQQAGQGQGK